MDANNALANISAAKKALDRARNLPAVLEIRDASVAAYAYATARNADDAAQIAMEIKLRSERKAGQFLQETDEIKRGGNQAKSRDVTLSSLGVSKMESSRWQRIAKIPEESFEEYVLNAKRKTQTGLLSLAHVARATGENEWYTPQYIIEAARNVMGIINVDPASSVLANEIIQAKKYFTKEENGLTQKWEGNVWMNPPYSQPLVAQFCDLLIEKYCLGEIIQACVLVNNATETGFYQNMMNYCKAICFIKGRVKFIDKNGESTGAPLQGQTVLYFGDNVKFFGEVFSKFGVVLYA